MIEKRQKIIYDKLPGGVSMNQIYGHNKKKLILPEELIIPKISTEELLRRYQILKPIVTVERMKYFIRDFSEEELRNLSYLLNCDDNKVRRIDLKSLEPVDDFLCLHTIGHYDLFRPVISEVLAQAPEISLQEANAFEIIESPKTEEDFLKYPEALEKGFQLSKVRTYRLHN